MSFAAPAVRLAGSASTLVTALSAAFPIALLLAPCGTHAQESAAAKDAPLPSVVVTGLPVCATSATWPYSRSATTCRTAARDGSGWSTASAGDWR